MQLLMRRPEIEGFISVAPPANLYDFSFLAPCPSSGLVVHGDADELVPVSDVETLTKKLASQRNITIKHREIKGAGHFFQDHLDDLTDEVGSYMDNALKEGPVLKAS
jgi:alpha/beta superfamily hydrolase